MHALSLSVIAERYARRFAFCAPLISSPPPANMRVCIVIPCYNEPQLLRTLDSLSQCKPPRHTVEVLLVFNCGLHEDLVRSSNRLTYQQVTAWVEENDTHRLRLHYLWQDQLPKKHAGVGLARKIGMDEALHRFARINYPGMIVCLDADCTVAANYLQALERVQDELSPGSCTVYFEHQPQLLQDKALREGIVYYELFLRYYVNALAYSGYPYSMHTIGSSMTVRADAYALSGGMNRRKAGEDFYFLHKVVPLESFHNITDTSVYPSGRISDRVPFGTGKAQQDWLKAPGKRQLAYHPDSFCDLKKLMARVPELYQTDRERLLLQIKTLPETVRMFLEEQGFEDKIMEIKGSSTSYQVFHKKFFAWFDGFKALKFVHYCKDHYYKKCGLVQACAWLLEQYGHSAAITPIAQLESYRQLDKKRTVVNLTKASSG